MPRHSQQASHGTIYATFRRLFDPESYKRRSKDVKVDRNSLMSSPDPELSAQSNVFASRGPVYV